MGHIRAIPGSPIANSSVNSSSWLQNKDQKEMLVSDFKSVYANDLAGNIDADHYPDTEARIAEKHAALAVMHALAEQDNLWVMPIGRNFPALSRLPPDDVAPMNNSDNTISRFQAVIVFDKNTGGMCVFDFGTFGCELHHSMSDFKQQFKVLGDFVKSASCQLGSELLAQAQSNLASEEHANLYSDFAKLLHKARGATRATFARMNFFYGMDCADTVRIKSGIGESNKIIIGFLPLLPELRDLVLAFGPEGSECKLTISSQAFQPAPSAPPIEFPSYFCDPKTKALMKDPVTTPGGYTGERTEVEKLSTDPATNKPLKKEHLRPNLNLKNAISEFNSSLFAEKPQIGESFQSHAAFFSQSASAKTQSKSVEPPDCLVCTLSFDLMEEPVMTPNGRSYDLKWITETIVRLGKDPVTDEPLKAEDLIPNTNLQQAIKYWEKQNQRERRSEHRSEHRRAHRRAHHSEHRSEQSSACSYKS